MREDVLYVRLKDSDYDTNYPIFPDDNYWQEKAKAIIGLLEIIIKGIDNKKIKFSTHHSSK